MSSTKGPSRKRQCLEHPVEIQYPSLNPPENANVSLACTNGSDVLISSCEAPNDHEETESCVSESSSHPPPAFWDNLSRVWLTPKALRELDRRNSSAGSRPLCIQLQTQPEIQSAPDFLRDCSPTRLKEIKSFAESGGPDLTVLRNYPMPQTRSSKKSSHVKEAAGHPLPKTAEDTETVTETTTISVYSRNFQQHLIDHGVYPYGYEYPNGEGTPKPNNLKEVVERLARPRRSLSPSRFTERDFKRFQKADAAACEGRPVETLVVPILDGNIGDPKCLGGDYSFANLAPLTDGTLPPAKPGHFFGARPEQLNRQIRQELGHHIVPSYDDLAIAPNFFLEATNPDFPPAIGTRQACYDGALGARGMHSLQSYRQEGLTYDNNAYTLTFTYNDGTLRLCTTHVVSSERSDGRPEYITTRVREWCLTGDLDRFREGVSAYRNARDWAKEQRDKLIREANERFAKTQPQHPSVA